MPTRKISIEQKQKRSAAKKGAEKIKIIVKRDAADPDAATEGSEGEQEQADNVVLEFPFSSEFPVERWWGNEILSHDKGAMMTDRMENFAPLLFNHNWDQQIGVVEKVWIDPKDNRAYCQVKMSRTDFALEKLQDIEDGILANVSFGYEVFSMTLQTENKDAANDYLVTEWMPYEISFVTVPADYTVGMNRSEDKNGQKEIDIAVPESAESGKKPNVSDVTVIENQNYQHKGDKMTPEEIRAAMQKRTNIILDFGQKMGMTDLARELINKPEMPMDDVISAFNEKMGLKQVKASSSDGNIGLSEKEIAGYSITNVVRAQLDPNNKEYQKAIAKEREYSEEAAKKREQPSQGIVIPLDILRSKSFVKRDLTVSDPTAGGFTVQDQLQSQSFIDLLRKKSVLQRAGATTFFGLQGNITFPSQTAAALAYWVGEQGAVTKSALTFGAVAMSPKTIGARTVISRKLLLQSSVDVEMKVRNDLALVLGLGIDYAGLYGLGSDSQPTGLNVTNGLSTKNFAGAVPTWGEIVDIETLIGAADADIDAMKYLVNANMNGSLKQTQKATNYPSYLIENGLMNGYGVEKSNQIADGDVWFGAWSQLAIGYWSGLDILANPYTEDDKGNVIITAFQDCDVAPMHIQSFAKGADNP